MNSKLKNRFVKILLLASVFILMMSLCGCRTRITNNDEVSNVMYDEDGYLGEEYDMRRDELSLSKAEKPLFTGLGSGGEEYDEYSDEDYDSFEDYEDYEDDEEYDDDEDTPAVTTPGTGGSGTTRPGGGTIIRRRPTTTPTTSTITVTLNANGGSCNTKAVLVKKGGKYGTLPSATRSGYEFSGWYTKKSGGTKIKKKTKVSQTVSHTLYAHWKKETEEKKEEEQEEEQEETKKTYTVTFDPNGDGASITSGDSTQTVEEDGKYGTTPVAERAGYTFGGWYTEAEGGSQVQGGDAFKANANQTLYAHWTKDPYTYWSNQFTEIADTVDDTTTFYIADEEKPSKGQKQLITDCNGKVFEFGEPDDEGNYSETPDYAVAFVSGIDPDEIDAANDEAAAIRERDPRLSGVTLILIDSDSVEGKDNEKLLYRLLFLDSVYQNVGDDNLGQAISDLGVEGIYPFVIPAGE